MKLGQVVATLGLEQEAEELQAEWEESQAARPEGEPPFLAPEFLREACRGTYVPEAVMEATVRAARRIAASEPLAALAWHYHYLLYRSKSAHWDRTCRWPAAPATLGEEAGRFYLVVLLSGYPTMQAVHQAHRIPPDIIRDTLLDLQIWFGNERGPDGLPDFKPVNVAWLMNHLRGDLYRLGRLQFQFSTMHYRLRVYRHRTTHLVLALSEDGIRFRSDGQVARSEEATAWTAQLRVTDDAVTGYPLLPTGWAVQREVTLPAAEWQQVLAHGDPVFNLHIPAGGPMSHAACGDSFRKAMAFFPEHYPDYAYRAFLCSSWILNTWLAEVLPPASNLVRFQREVYLFPTGVWPSGMVNRIFGGTPTDLAAAPRDTQLQRAILDALAAGHSLEGGGGGCFLFPEDFDWGAEVYRRQGLPFGL